MKISKIDDNPTIVRKITHSIIFKTEEDRNAFLIETETENYLFICAFSHHDFNDGHPYVIQIMKSDKTDWDSIIKFTQIVGKIAKKYNGHYDSWETAAVDNKTNIANKEY